MIIEFYQNKRNPHKFQEIHSDGYGHYTLREVMRFENGVINYVGDKKLHRWKFNAIQDLLMDDYWPCPDDSVWKVINATCLCCHKTYSYVLDAEEEKAYEKYWDDKCYGRFPGYIQDVFPKMPQHFRASIQSENDTCCSCPRCNPFNRKE